MTKKPISTDSAPKAIGPYSQGISAGDLVFVSGQTPIDPATGSLVPGDAAVQARRCLENLKAVLEAGGSSLEHVVKTTVFLIDMADFKAMNGVYAEFFGSTPPARSTVAVAGLPLGARVEIEAVGVKA